MPCYGVLVRDTLSLAHPYLWRTLIFGAPLSLAHFEKNSIHLDGRTGLLRVFQLKNIPSEDALRTRTWPIGPVAVGSWMGFSWNTLDLVSFRGLALLEVVALARWSMAVA